MTLSQFIGALIVGSPILALLVVGFRRDADATWYVLGWMAAVVAGGAVVSWGLMLLIGGATL